MAVMLIALGVVGVAAECTDAQAKAFEKWDQDWTKYNAEGNRAELEKIYADDFQGIGGLSLGTDKKKEIIDNAVKNVGSNPNVKSSSHNFLITCTPNTVTIVHRTTFNVTTDGNESTFWNRNVHILEKRNGNWQAVSSISHPTGRDDEGAIFNLELDSDQAAMRRDLDWFKKNYTDDFIGTTQSGTRYDKKQMVAYLENLWKGGKAKLESARLSNIAIRVDGNMGVVNGVRHGKGIGADGKPFDDKNRFTHTFVKRDGKWMRIASSSNKVKEDEATAQ